MHTIRQANINDSVAIKRLVAETLLHCVLEEGEAYRTLFGEVCALIDSWVDDPKGMIHFVCEQGEDIVGVVFISHYEKMNLLFVHPTRQRVGIGKALLDSALEACRRMGQCKQITLNSSRYAEPFYLRYGFTLNGKPENKPGGCIPMIFNL